MAFPRSWLDGRPDFSFSGLKTAVLRVIRANPDLCIPDLCASVQAAIVDVLVTKTLEAAIKHGVRQVMLTGGVAANSCLRERMRTEASGLGLRVATPPRSLCTDNAAMIAVAGWLRLRSGETDGLMFDTEASLPLGQQDAPAAP
jgi:N6-L-threonylcarbamoyladenine synthase